MKYILFLIFGLVFCPNILGQYGDQRYYDDQEKIRRWEQRQQEKDAEMREIAKQKYDGTYVEKHTPEWKEGTFLENIFVTVLMLGISIWVIKIFVGIFKCNSN